jgi:ribosome-associated protein
MRKPNKEFCKLVESVLNDTKAKNVTKIDLFDKSSLCDYMFIATGTSNMHVKAMGDNIVKAFKKIGIAHISREGGENNNWIVLDIGDIIVHIFQQEVRDLYRLEELWQQNNEEE